MNRLCAVILLFLIFLAGHTAQAAVDGKAMPGIAAKAVSAAKRGLSFENLSTLRKKGGGRLFKNDELLVKFKAGASAEKRKNTHQRHGVEKLKEFPRLSLEHVRVRKGMTLEEAIRLYQADPDVDYAEPNYLQSVQAQPNDPKFPELWGLQNTGQNGGATGADIRAASAWNITTGSSEVVVAVIDSGVDYTHPDLQANMWVNSGEIPGNGLDDDGNGYVDDVYGINTIDAYHLEGGDPMDDAGHGTHVAGTIGAAGNNGRGVVGVNWSVKMLACKFISSDGYGWTSDAVECLEYIRGLKDRGVNVVATSNSWGGGGYSQALYDAIKAQEDILFIAAAGNSSLDMDSTSNYPAGYDLPNIISVAATDNTDYLASFSNYGKGTVDVGAPGVGIVSTVPTQGILGSADGYASFSGTSMATPHVTGLAALLKAQDPARNYRQIKNLIMTGGDSVSSLAGRTVTGRRINAYNSLTCANRKLFALGPLPRKVVPGQSYTVTVTSIICDGASGPVKLSTSEGDLIDLTDDGVAPDLQAGDGIFTARWTPRTSTVTATFSSPAGSASSQFNDLEIGYHLPVALRDRPYSQPLFATGGTPPYTWRVSSGYLQGGMNLSSSGVISGTPNENGSCNGACPFTAEVTDALGNKITRVLQLIVDQGWAQESWGRIYDSTSEDRALAVAQDTSGNAYVTGQSHNGLDTDLILLKYAPDGRLLWKQSYNRGDNEIGRSVACDKSGNVYVAGVTGSPGNHLLLKFDGAGNLLWEKVWDRGGDDGAWGVATDTAGNSYTVGTFQEGENSRVLLSKYSADGESLWTRVHETVAADEAGYSLALDGSGNIFFGGAASTAGGTDFLVAKYDSAANLLWSSTQHDSTSNALSAVAADGSGNLYATGSATADGLTHAVTMKFDPAGNLLWKTTPAEVGPYGTRYRNFSPQGIAIAGEKIFVAGRHQPLDSNLLIVRYDPLGSKIWDYSLDIGLRSMDNGGTIAATSSGFTVAGYGHNGLNNDILTARFTEPAPIYDLQVTGLSGVVRGSHLDYTLTVKNSTVGMPRFRVGLWLSTDATLSDDDQPLSPLVDTTVPGGSERTYTNWPYGTDSAKVVAIPGSLPGGSYYLLSRVDPEKQVNETNENNNVFSGGKVLVNSDLTISAVSGTVAGGNLNYSVTVHSSANFATATSNTGIYLSKDPATPRYLIASHATATPSAGGDTVVTGSAPVPVDVPPGSYYVSAIADTANAIAETDEDNNFRSGNLVTLASDLSVTALSGATAGGILSYSVTVANAGHQAIAPSVGLYFSPTASASTSGNQVAVIDLPSIAGGTASTLSGTVVVPGTVPYGDYYLTALVDPANVVTESNEGNNGAVAGAVTVNSTPAVLSLTRSGQGGGAVSFSPGKSCSGSCLQYFLPGTQVTLTATADSASDFAGWGGACNGTGSCTVTAGGELSVSATFLRMIPSVSVGERHAISLIGGTLWGWGGNPYGAFGDGTTNGSTSPRRVPALAGITATAGGYYHTLALKEDGTVLTWGYNGSGQLGDGSTTARTSPAQLAGLSEVAAVEATDFSSLALLRNGTVWSWGDNNFGQVGDGTNTRRTTPVQVPGISGVVGLAGGGSHVLALKEDGTVWSWGWNLYYQLGLQGYNARYTPTAVGGVSDIVALAAGSCHSVALKDDGTVWTWGCNYSGELGDGTNVTRYRPFQLPGISDVVAIAAGGGHTVALKGDGTVWTWGVNTYGELGDGTTQSRQTPTQVVGLSGVVGIAAGYGHSFAIKSDRTIWAFGQNYYGDLGDGTTTQRTTPVLVRFDTVAPSTTASPAGGAYTGTQTVTLSADETAAIYYTLDGSTPTTASALYSAPIAISTSTVLKHAARDAAGNMGTAKSETYMIAGSPLPVASLQEAYNAAADGGEIKTRAEELFENPIFDREIYVKIRGGYDSPYQQVVGATVVRGKMTVKKGRVALWNLVLR